MQQIQISQSNSKQTKVTFKILNKKLQKLIYQFKRMDPKNGLEFYQYPIYQKQDLKDVQEYKTLIMIGQTGSGKTTLINFFLNYYLGIQFTDDFRINLINESDLKKHSSQSQTQDVIIYYIKPFNNNPGLRIIDTPGFGDTRGILQDKIIAEKIHQCFLTNVETLTSICFFVQSSNARLTINQNYILSQLLQIFGKDVIENLIFMFTFCDGGAPQAKQALEFKGNDDNNNGRPVADLISNIPQPWFLKFNSSAFTANNKGINGEDAEMTQLFWNIGIKSFESLIEKLRKNQDISLQLTRDVIKQRKIILIVIDHLRLSIYKLLNLIENHKQTYQQIGQIDAAIISSKNFKIKQTKFRIDKIDLKQGQYVTNCINCNYTCHFPCTIPEDNNKSNCASMSNNQCTVCQNKCHWSVHKNNNFRFETTSYEDYIELSELKKSYSQSESQKTQKQQILDGIENQYIFANAECMEQQNQLMIAINKLNLIALQPAVFKHEEEYLELMIQEEKNKKDHGWKERIITLQEMKENWKLVRETCTHTGQVQLTQEFYKEKIKIKKENKGLWSKIFS